ncbi:BTB/POZ domain-containing protein [Phlyctema vagabunda]|uniref:BTB/POZ domain-containing protein n=1 Tax=Phlyctema vagabunda TaxID=108571 RepID=A0ABR4P2P9_9HELO
MSSKDTKGAATRPAINSDRPEKLTKKKHPCGTFSEIINLRVGPDEHSRVFKVHKEILCASSPVLASACKPEWKSDDNEIHLPEDDPDAIWVTLHWIYSRILYLPRKIFKEVTVSSGLESGPGLLVKIYVLAEKYQICDLVNTVITCLAKLNTAYENISAAVIGYAYKNTHGSSSENLRKLLLDLVLWDYTADDLNKAGAALGVDCLLQVAIRRVKACTGCVVTTKESCISSPCTYYHKHTDGTSGVSQRRICLKEIKYTLVDEE